MVREVDGVEGWKAEGNWLDLGCWRYQRPAELHPAARLRVKKLAPRSFPSAQRWFRGLCGSHLRGGGGSQLRMLTSEKQGSPGRTTTRPRTPKLVARTKKLTREPERSGMCTVGRAGQTSAWSGLRATQDSGPVLSWQQRSAGDAQARSRPESWRPRTPWSLRSSFLWWLLLQCALLASRIYELHHWLWRQQ